MWSRTLGIALVTHPNTSPWWGQTEETPGKQCHRLVVSAEEDNVTVNKGTTAALT